MIEIGKFNDFKIRPSKHFILDYMRKWRWDDYDLKIALEGLYKLEKVGKYKYEGYTRHGAKGNSRKIIFVADEEYKEIFIISGAEGK